MKRRCMFRAGLVGAGPGPPRGGDVVAPKGEPNRARAVEHMKNRFKEGKKKNLVRTIFDLLRCCAAALSLSSSPGSLRRRGELVLSLLADALLGGRRRQPLRLLVGRVQQKGRGMIRTSSGKAKGCEICDASFSHLLRLVYEKTDAEGPGATGGESFLLSTRCCRRAERVEEPRTRGCAAPHLVRVSKTWKMRIMDARAGMNET